MTQGKLFMNHRKYIGHRCIKKMHIHICTWIQNFKKIPSPSMAGNNEMYFNNRKCTPEASQIVDRYSSVWAALDYTPEKFL